METTVDFESASFIPFLPEAAQVNPGIFGAELAWWLARELAQRGVATSYPNPEDWGWYLEYRAAEGHDYLLCCANIDGAMDRWRCYLEPRAKSLFGRTAPIAGASALMLALRDVLAQNPGIMNVSWR